ncbi:MAG: S8 family serine peptidase [Bacteroidetes bacterium]|nr:S8 family serine peptidase [Bacteroidota bacterium]
MRKKFYHILILFLLLSTVVFSQKTAPTTNVEVLESFAREKTIAYERLKAYAIEWANLNGYPVRLESEGQLMEIQYIDAFGNPQYYMTDNSVAASTISTNQVYSGGSAGLNLDGSGITVREWDGGGVRTTHQEYGGRVVMGDGASPTSDHSTHVAGTIMAAGVQPNAKGMAFNASLRAFDWNNDNGEMAIEGAAGTLMSNHSYGFVRGWYWTGATWAWNGNNAISNQEDYLFGFYDSYSRDWDIIAQNAPYYLIVKSAGNDRGDGPGTFPPNDGPFDCIGQQGVSKNILTVGAVEDIPGGYAGPASVVMSSFSSWGPADDGRIKPDVVTNGVSLYSTDDDNNADYTTMSGTSMASPSATGSLALLQQHWEDLNGTGNYMLSSTLKALVIHTADEAGANDGPDYSYGWGLMNTQNAALKISEDQVINVVDEINLNQGNTYTRSVYNDGTEPLKVTICWTDEPGNPVSAQLDPINPMLINDLDLRITTGSNTYYAWKLDRNNPANAATNNGENDVDNVEVVYIASPLAGDYTITVDHDGVLSGGSQVFSIVFSGISLNNVPPVANFIANNTTPLPGETIDFTDLSSNGPTSWSWSFSPSTITYVGGTDATSENPQVQFDALGLYTVTLVATNAYGSDTEIKTDYIDVSPCSYCLSEGDMSYNTSTTLVQFNTINNSSGKTAYSDYTAISTDVMQGSSHDLTVNVNTDGPYTVQTFAWIDWNQDCDFDDPGEAYDLGSATDVFDRPTSASPLRILVPADAVVGTTRMRVSTRYRFDPLSCDFGFDGEVEDYSVNVLQNLSPPTANFVADDVNPIVAQTVSFIDLSTNGPTSWFWSFTPATITFTGGTVASSQNPQVQFEAEGLYTVTLIATNGNGSDTEVKTDYIDVAACSYCQSYGSMVYETGTRLVEFNTISNASPEIKPAPYNDYTSISTDVIQGSSHDLLVRVNTDGNFTVQTFAWIDWNQDCDFDDSGESFDMGSAWGVTNGLTSASPYSVNVPMDAQLGTTRMRVATRFWSDPASCSINYDGEVEDYSVNVLPRLITWTGNNSTNWDIASNWDYNMVPSADNDVLIPASPVGGRFPEIVSATLDAQCNDMEIETGANISIFGGLTVEGVLTNNEGVDGIIVQSDPTTTGSLITNTNNVEATVERYLTDGVAHFIGAPVNDAVIGDLFFDHNPEVWLYQFHENDESWEFLVPLDTPMPLGKGYYTWVDNTTRQNVTADFQGSLRSTDLTLNTSTIPALGYTHDTLGLNFVSNPFPSALDWDIGSWQLTNVDGTIWVWSSATGNYLYRNSMSLGNLTEGIIPVSQAFFIKATAANPILTIPADARVHAAQQFYTPDREETELPLIVLEVQKAAKSDEIWVAFCDSCTEDYNNGFDVYKRFGDVYSPQFYATENDLILSIDALPYLSEEGKTIPLGFVAGENGMHEIILKGFAGLEHTDVILEDMLSEELHLISEIPNYSFFANTNDPPDRFLLHIGSVITDTPVNEGASDYHIYSSNKIIYIKRSGTAANQKVAVQLIDIYGRIVSEVSFTPAHLNQIVTQIEDNIIIVRVVSEEGLVIAGKVFIK